MASNFDVAHAFTAKWEGGISDHPADRGGLTVYGVSTEFLTDVAKSSSGKNFLQSIGVALPVCRNSMLKISLAQAAQIFKRQFWTPLSCDALPLRPAILLYDAAVNHGARQSVKFAQRGVNTVYRNRLVIDGLIGPKSLAALCEPTPAMLDAILEQRRLFYNNLCLSKPSQQVFLKGWLNRVNDLQAYVAKLHD